MRPSRSVGQLAVVLLSLAPLAAAWPSWAVDIDALVVRQDDGTTAAPSKTSGSDKAAETGDVNTATTHNLNTAENTKTDGSASETGSDQESGTATGTAKITGGGGGKNSTKTGGKPKHTQFDPQSPAGSVVMVTPSAAMGEQLYKIGDKITFGWNYTNLLGTPTAVDVLASCSTVSKTYTLTQNMTFETKPTITWDTKQFQDDNKVILPVEEYTLVIYDAESSASATAEPGYLGTFNGLTFGLYTPRPYTPLDEGWTCASCNAAVSALDKRALGFALTMGLITVLSFTWFVTGLGVVM